MVVKSDEAHVVCPYCGARIALTPVAEGALLDEHHDTFDLPTTWGEDATNPEKYVPRVALVDELNADADEQPDE